MKEYQLVGREVIAEGKPGVITHVRDGRERRRIFIRLHDQSTAPLSINTTMFFFPREWNFV